MTKRDPMRGGPLVARLAAAAAVALGLIAVAVSGALAGSAARSDGARDAARAAEADVIPGQYIVVYEEDLERGVNRETRQRERRLGFESGHRYRHAIEGFAARLTSGQVRALERDPDVAHVSEDRRVRIAAEVPLESGETVPTGIHRIRAATQSTAREASGVGVAVIDTGVKLDHDDLVVEDGKDCVDPGTEADDEHGHGTHVAGTIAAANQGSGVVGVAPGTTIHPVRVLDDEGSGTWAQVICGIDWATANVEELDIRVANMSLGGLGSAVRPCGTTTDSIHKAICQSTDAGVTYVVAAGNWGDGEQDAPWEFDHPTVPNIPAAYPQVLTVTAIADSDGAPGGTGKGPNCSAPDDSPAPFSNFALTAAGSAHTIAAPGCRIRSTNIPGRPHTLSGTSMAAPHVAGVVALCIDEGGVEGECAGLDPDQIIDHVRAEAQAYNEAEHPGPGAGLGYGFLGDPLNPQPGNEYFGFLTVVPGAVPSGPDDPDDPGDPGQEPDPFENGDDPGDGTEDPLEEPVDPVDPGDPDSPSGDPPADGTVPAVVAKSMPAALEIRRARLRGKQSNRRLIVRGSLAPDAAGDRVVVRFRARGRQLRLRPLVRADGSFALERTLRGRQRRARAGRLAVRYRGNDTLRPASERLRAARRPVRLRTTGNAPRIQGGRVVVAGRVHEAAGGQVRVAVEFNRADGSPGEVTGLAEVNRRGRFRARLRVPSAAQADQAHVALTHRGRGPLHGQRIGHAIGA